MTAKRLSLLQRRILAWLVAEVQRMQGGTLGRQRYQDLRRALAHDKGTLSHSLANLKAKGFIMSSVS